ncbi:hypothetical protein FRC01_006844 [Tulasnella sp. 417]|nr:hypothetical protein FRC01_006844 [Tulasnella sp. 417]
MPPQEVDTVTRPMQFNRGGFTEPNDAELPGNPDAPALQALLEIIESSGTPSSQPSDSVPPSPSVASTFRAPSNLGSYAASEMTSTDNDTMVTWEPAEVEPHPLGEQFVVAEDERPDTPVGPRIQVHPRPPQGFETPKRQVPASLTGTSRSRSTLRLEGMVPPPIIQAPSRRLTPKKKSVSPSFNAAEPPEPDLFDGTVGQTCCEFVRSVYAYAFKNDKYHDPKWIAAYAATRLTGNALVWHSSQPPNVTDDWQRLKQALLDAFHPGGSTFTPGSSPGATSTFAPSSTGSTASPLSSNGPQSPPLLSPDSSILLSPPSGSVRTKSSSRSLMMSSHVSLASESSLRMQSGQLLIEDNTGRRYYLRIRLGWRGGCKPTSDKSESLRVRDATRASRRFYLDNSSSHYAALGISWCIKRHHTPHLSKGSFDCADLVYLDNNGTSSSKDAHGPSGDAIWTVRDDNSVQVLWHDNEKIEHELHAVMKPESSRWGSLVSPARILLVKDPDAFIPQNPGYILSRFVFQT